MNKYEPQIIEPKWQKIWEEQKIFEVAEIADKKKFFGLIEFPYPSGDGLHTGHLRSNTAMDIICRKRRMQGYNVLYPIGFDAFGLPTENYAIKKKIKPQEATEKNIATFTKQLKEAGFSFDWGRSFSTTDEDYYKWTQWIFVQMFKAGLAEKKKETINWCTSCKIGLANEEVVNGVCERCGGEVIKKVKEQWVLKITKYADRLIEDLDKVDYLERIKTQQVNWIGRSNGAEIRFKIYDLPARNASHGEAGGRFKNEPIDELLVFTTRPDTLFGATFMVVAPEHPIIQNYESGIMNYAEVKEYIEEARKKSDLERTDLNKEKTGVELKGIKAINPVNGKEIPIFVADYVMMGYGTGAIMAVPAHDERDFEFAKKYNLEIKKVIQEENKNCVIVHGSNDNEQEAKEGEPENLRHWKPWLKENLEKYGIKVSNELYPNDWMPNYDVWKKVFEKNEINENTILIGHSAGAAFILRWLVENKKKVAKVILIAPSIIKSDKYISDNHLKDFEFDSSLKKYFNHLIILFSANDDEYIINSAKKVHETLGGELIEFKDKGHFIFSDMGTNEFPELLEKVLELKVAFVEIDSGEMVNSDFLNDLKPNEAIIKMIQWLEEKGLGKKQIQYKLHDWIFSRQRYWGEPIPMVYCEKCAQKKMTFLVIHGFTGHSQENWFPWFKKEMENRGAKVIIPDLPNTNKPKLEEWLDHLKGLEKDFEGDLVVIGHSLGAPTACKFIEENDLTVQKLILVAPASEKSLNYQGLMQRGFNESDLNLLKDFLTLKFDWEKINKKVAERIIYLSKDDPYINLKAEKEFEWLGAGVKVFENKGHFSSSNGGILELPEILEEFPELLNKGWSPIPEKDLPVVLPNIDDYLPTDEGDSPLAKKEEWVKTKCPVCGGEARRETDVMPNWAGSNWYFIRYTDPKNDKQMVDPEKAKYWLPVDWYNGGMEHTTLHLLYSRFVWKFLYDIGAVPKECGVEPYAKRTAHGMILGEGGVKMSKSKGNVINPDEYVKKYGADTLRVYEMFMGPFDLPIAWEDKSVNGVYRFLNRIWNLQEKLKSQNSKVKIESQNSKLTTLLHQMIKKVGEDIEEMKFNTAVAAMMILLNELEKQEEISVEHYSLLIVLLSPFAPHLAEELWEKLGHDKSIMNEKWPEYDSKLIQDKEFELVVQVNGKVRERILVPAEINEAEVRDLVMKNEKVLKWLEDKEPKKVIYIKGKLLSVVI